MGERDVNEGLRYCVALPEPSEVLSASSVLDGIVIIPRVEGACYFVNTRTDSQDVIRHPLIKYLS